MVARYHDLANPGKLITFSGGELMEAWGMPPFSVFNARTGPWQDRKNGWLKLGIKSEIGRGANLLKMSDTILEPDAKKRAAKAIKTINTDDWVNDKIADGDISGGLAGSTPGAGTSIFDPVLCEMFYRWFVPEGGYVLDPFAGGSVRGIVASICGRNYLGLDLREEQVVENRRQAKELCKGYSMPEWITTDSLLIDYLCEPETLDAVFSCPPFFDLEKYCDDPRDLSNMKYDGFLEVYGSIITKCAAVLKPDTFACFVVGEVRDANGFCRGLVPDTIRLFERAGLRLYNDAILITSVGSLPIRADKQFDNSRKLGRTHQYVLVFCKGDPKEATRKIGAYNSIIRGETNG